jgi:hypothetical protein
LTSRAAIESQGDFKPAGLGARPAVTDPTGQAGFIAVAGGEILEKTSVCALSGWKSI